MRTRDLPKQRDEAEATPAAIVQADFFDDGSFGVELSTLDAADSRHGKYSGAELERRVLVRDQVVKWLAQGVGIRRIVKELRAAGVPIGEHSILAFRDRRPDLVATEKKELSTQLGRIIKLCADSIEDRLASGSMKPSSVDLAVFIDKKAGVDGEANFVIEHKFTMDASADAFARRLEEMKRATLAERSAGPALAGAEDSQASVIDVNPNKKA